MHKNQNPIFCSGGCGRIVGYTLLGKWEGTATCPSCEGRPEPDYPESRSLWHRVFGE